MHMMILVIFILLPKQKAICILVEKVGRPELDEDNFEKEHQQIFEID